MIKFSIENAYWENEDIVLNIVDIIGRFYSNKRSLSAESHSNYGQINEWKNYMESTIISIDIATLFIDIKINLALSHLITLPENKVPQSLSRSTKKKSTPALVRLRTMSKSGNTSVSSRSAITRIRS
jgi:hypothetical protein